MLIFRRIFLNNYCWLLLNNDTHTDTLYKMYMFQVIMPGYCVAGTVGHKILNGARRLEMENKQTVSNKVVWIDVKCKFFEFKIILIENKLF